MKKKLYANIILILFLSFAARAENDSMTLSLENCIRAGLMNNFDVKVSKINLEIKDQEIIKKESDFDPSVNISAGRNFSHLSSSQNFAGISASKKTRTGADIELSHGINKTGSGSNGNSSYNSSLELRLTQPLLKNAGKEVNTLNLKLEYNNKIISQNDLNYKIMSLCAGIEKKYWDMVYYEDLLEVRKQNLKLAEDLLENNKKQVELGSLAPVEITRAAAGAASREEGIITAENNLNGARDELLYLMNIEEKTIGMNGKIYSIDKPKISGTVPDLKESINFAFSNLPEYLTFKKKLENSSLKLNYYKNQELPSLDLETTFKLNGIDGEWNESYSEMKEYDNTSWSVKFGFKIPIGNRFNKAVSNQEKLSNSQLLLQFKQLD